MGGHGMGFGGELLSCRPKPSYLSTYDIDSAGDDRMIYNCRYKTSHWCRLVHQQTDPIRIWTDGNCRGRSGLLATYLGSIPQISPDEDVEYFRVVFFL